MCGVLCDVQCVCVVASGGGGGGTVERGENKGVGGGAAVEGGVRRGDASAVGALDLPADVSEVRTEGGSGESGEAGTEDESSMADEGVEEDGGEAVVAHVQGNGTT